MIHVSLLREEGQGEAASRQFQSLSLSRCLSQLLLVHCLVTSTVIVLHFVFSASSKFQETVMIQSLILILNISLCTIVAMFFMIPKQRFFSTIFFFKIVDLLYLLDVNSSGREATVREKKIPLHCILAQHDPLPCFLCANSVIYFPYDGMEFSHHSVGPSSKCFPSCTFTSSLHLLIPSLQISLFSLSTIICRPQH